MKNNHSNELIKSATGTIVKINLHFLQAVVFGLIAWWCYPERPFDIGWGLVSFICVLVVLAAIASAIRDMSKLYQRDNTIKAYLQQGAQPKTSTLANDDIQKKAGMR